MYALYSKDDLMQLRLAYFMNFMGFYEESIFKQTKIRLCFVVDLLVKIKIK